MSFWKGVCEMDPIQKLVPFVLFFTGVFFD